ncbi:MAG TPA: site-specific integrase [Bryobacteraceae bacterium]|jgi:integrase|nr:site-specific integrase [Bryobacteraceae bacterium]
MALRLRGQKWYADYYANGERVVECTGTANRREAEKFLALRISEVQRDVFVKPVQVLLHELWERYLPYAKTHKRSWKRDEQLYANLIGFLGSVKLGAITQARVEEYQEHRVTRVAPATVNREVALLKHMFNMAERWGVYRGANPVRFVKFLAEDNLKCETLSEKEEERLLAAAPPYLKDLVVFAVNTGLRRSDVFNLKWEDVDIEKKHLTIVVRKNRKPQTVFLNPIALEVVARQRQDGPRVFTNPMTGEPIKCVRGGLDAAVKRAGLKKITFHMFRHTVATRLLENGADIVTVKEIMGHANINTTLRYAHTSAERQRRMIEKLSERSEGKVRAMPKAADDNGNKTVATIPQKKVG